SAFHYRWTPRKEPARRDRKCRRYHRHGGSGKIGTRESGGTVRANSRLARSTGGAAASILSRLPGQWRSKRTLTTYVKREFEILGRRVDPGPFGSIWDLRLNRFCLHGGLLGALPRASGHGCGPGLVAGSGSI